MRRGAVYYNGIIAGVITEEHRKSYIFQYDKDYLLNKDCPSISLTLPKRDDPYQADHLFPFFFNMLSEGENKKLQCRRWKIDEDDHFGLLLKTAQTDTIGPITIKQINET